MRFYFIRHGQSENNLLWDETGASDGRSEDPELTAMGSQQASHLANFILCKDKQSARNGRVKFADRDTFQFTHLYTSLMVRSVKTGYTLAEAFKLPLIAWPEFHECGGIYLDDKKSGDQSGEFEKRGLPGKTKTYFRQHYKHLQLPDSITDSGWWNRPYEEENERPLRAQKVLQELIERHGNSDDSVAIISHGGFYMEFIKVLFHIPNDLCWFLMNNTGVTRIDFWGENGITLVYHNRTDHLENHLIT